jgi:hypothetical protein
MSGRDLIRNEPATVTIGESGADLLRPLVEAPLRKASSGPSIEGIVIGELIAMKDDGRTPLVLFAGQRGSAALGARTVIDLYGAHIGRKVVLMFEGGDPDRPIVMGVLRESEGWPLADPTGQVEIDSDGERMIVTAKEQVVLRCGKASITLTKAGKVLIQGSYVLSRSSGVNRIKGGSVQLN